METNATEGQLTELESSTRSALAAHRAETADSLRELDARLAAATSGLVTRIAELEAQISEPPELAPKASETAPVPVAATS